MTNDCTGSRNRPDWQYQPVQQQTHQMPVTGSSRRSQRSSWCQNIYPRVSGGDAHPWTSQLDRPGVEASYRTEAPRYEYDAYQQDYEDPPPPSAIKTYRSSRSEDKAPIPWSAVGDGAESTPSLLSTNFRSPANYDPAPRREREISNTLTVQPSVDDSGRTPSLSPLSLQITSALPTTPSDSAGSDSFFGRAFAASVEASSSREVTSSGPSSSQSHRTQVRLAAEPTVLTRTVGGVQQLKVMRLSDTPPGLYGFGLVSMPEEEMPAANSVPSYSQPQQQQHPHQRAYGYSIPQPLANANHQPLAYNDMRCSPSDYNHDSRLGELRLPRHVPRRAQIVLPAPLAPTVHPSNHTTMMQPLSFNATSSSSVSPLGPLPLSVHGSSALTNGLRRSNHSNLRRASYPYASRSPVVTRQALVPPVVLE